MNTTLFLQIITIISLIIITSIIVKRAFYMATIKRDPIRAFFPFITEPGRVLINKRTGETKDAKSWVNGEPRNAKHWTEEIKEEIKEKLKKDILQGLKELNQKHEGKDYLFGDYSLGHVSMTPHLAALPRLGLSISEDLTYLKGWFDRIQARPSFTVSQG